MFRAQTQSRGGYYGRPIATTAFPVTCEQDNLGAPDPEPGNRVQPNGYSVKTFVDYYKNEGKGVPIVFPSVSLKAYPKGFTPSTVWGAVHTNPAKAMKVARGVMDILAQEKMEDAMFRIPPDAVLPTGAAAQTAYANFSRITALLQRSDYVQLVNPNNVAAIAAGVTKTTSTPLFSAFLVFMRSPPPPLLPQQQSKAMFVDLVRRAVMMNNAGTTWEEITGPVNAIPVSDSIPVAQAVPADSKGGGFTAFDGFPQPGKP